MTYPNDMWIVANVVTPLMVLAGLAIILVLGDRAAKKHRAARDAKAKAFGDKMAGK